MNFLGHLRKNFVRGWLQNRSFLKTMATDASTPIDSILDDKSLFPDRPTGPLDRYRKRASFDWRKLSLLLDNEECLRFRNYIWDYLENEPLFARTLDEMSLDETRRVAAIRHLHVITKQFISLSDFIMKPDVVYTYLLAMISYEPSSTIKASLSSKMFPGILRSMGNDAMVEISEAAEIGKFVGAFALTEIAHGSYTLGMRTTAHYDVTTKQFIINTPDFEAAKCWVGNLGKTCTHAIVYAQLYTPDGQHHGLNGFLVPIRDTKTLKPFAGVSVGDMGAKVGLNGVDNGFVMFDHYRIPREYLLSKLGHITDDGQFVSPIKDPKKRIGASFGSLSGGRVNICGLSNCYLISAISIALRYSASRKQFRDDDSIDELPVLEYQSQQYRLLPHLATAIAQKVFTMWQVIAFSEFTKEMLMGNKDATRGMEIHALTSSTKPICTWAVRDAIQDCREAAGGHGFLKVARFGELRNDNDPNCTYEGENNVLLQQTSNWLLSVRKNGHAAFKGVSPLQTADFLAEYEQIAKHKFTTSSRKEAVAPENLLRGLNWLVAYHLEKTYERSQALKKTGLSSFEVRNEIQVFHAQSLSIVYAQRMIFKTFMDFVVKCEPSAERNVLEKLVSLYGANLQLKHMSSLFEGGYLACGQQSVIIKEGMLELLRELKNESISIVDAIAPNDFILNSPLGMSDGDVYRHLQSIFWQTPGTFERVEWWKDIVPADDASTKSKL